MLEDDHDRIRRFREIVARHHPDAVLKIARTSPDFKTEYWSLNDTPDLICLDHDLFTDSPDDPDPGDGYDVTRFLITRPAKCPALIHSTNAPAADSMMFSMRDAGWTVDRIAESEFLCGFFNDVVPSWVLKPLSDLFDGV